MNGIAGTMDVFCEIQPLSFSVDGMERRRRFRSILRWCILVSGKAVFNDTIASGDRLVLLRFSTWRDFN